ncbi:MAG TPA: hypothetical protein VG870_01115 [Chitinophagaceae bacterium]|nr:hypothetical protein [Chitinophagaceae bacterium]
MGLIMLAHCGQCGYTKDPVRSGGGRFGGPDYLVLADLRAGILESVAVRAGEPYGAQYHRYNQDWVLESAEQFYNPLIPKNRGILEKKELTRTLYLDPDGWSRKILLAPWHPRAGTKPTVLVQHRCPACGSWELRFQSKGIHLD